MRPFRWRLSQECADVIGCTGDILKTESERKRARRSARRRVALLRNNLSLELTQKGVVLLWRNTKSALYSINCRINYDIFYHGKRWIKASLSHPNVVGSNPSLNSKGELIYAFGHGFLRDYLRPY